MTRVGLVVSVLLTLCLVAWCQDVGELDGLREDRRIAEEEIVLDFSVNYGYAYRARSWAPVDVFVRNDKVDVSGWVEVRLYDVEGAVQSPIYRVRAESPKGSVKRFQLCCYMGTVSRMEVQLYRGGDVDGGGRAVVDFPPYQDLTPIDEQDLMGLVLDDESSGFGFLTEAINTSGQEPLRFHREALSREELLRLAKYAPCYTPFDVIIMGNTEPSRIGRRQRELLYDYVVGGGTIVVCTGEFARWYHRTWVEELAGVEIRAGETVNELDLAAAVFDKAGQVGARGHRDYAVAELTPVLEGVKKFGRDRVLATRRDLGSGRVYVMAVDADSHALQGSLGYKSLWREAVRRRKARRLNYASASSHVGEVLPHISGIVIHSKSSVMTYLALYFGIAIVANWLFFSWLKRREWAWAMLLVFSFGFTAYAVVYGTAGRARTRELYQLELLRVPQGGGMSELRSTVGVLTPRSTTLNLDVSGEYVLAQDLGDVPGAMRRMSNMMRVNRRPFYLQQDGSPRVSGFRVGASEIRLLNLASDYATEGGVDGFVTVDEWGHLKAEFVNNTGHAVKNPFLCFAGSIFPLQKTRNDSGGVVYTADVPTFADQGVTRVAVTPARSYVGARSVRRRGQRSDSASQASKAGWGLSRLKQDYPVLLLAKDYYGFTDGEVITDPSLGPFFCGWLREPGLGRVNVDQVLSNVMKETLLVADVELRGGGARRLPLLTFAAPGSGVGSNRRGGLPRNTTWNHDYRFMAGDKPEFCVLLPQEALEYGTDDLRIELYDAGWQNKPVVFRPVGAEETWPSNHVIHSGGDDRATPTVTYRIEDWRERVQPLDSAGGGAGWAISAWERFSGETMERPVALILGAVEVAGLEEGRPLPPDQLRVQLRASLLLLPKRADHGGSDAWH